MGWLMGRRSFEIRSALTAPASEVWRQVTTLDGVNAELAPWFRMSGPARLHEAALSDAPVGQRLGRCWLLLFGVLPVEYDDLVLATVEPLAFVESSSMLLQRTWRHERRLEANAAGCTVTDRVSWEPRLAGAGLLLSWVVPALFRHRHARLGRRFGVAGHREGGGGTC